MDQSIDGGQIKCHQLFKGKKQFTRSPERRRRQEYSSKSELKLDSGCLSPLHEGAAAGGGTLPPCQKGDEVLNGGWAELVVRLTGKGGILFGRGAGGVHRTSRTNLNSGNNGLSREQGGGRLTTLPLHNLPNANSSGQRTCGTSETSETSGTFVPAPLPLRPAPPQCRRRSCCDEPTQRRLP